MYSWSMDILDESVIFNAPALQEISVYSHRTDLLIQIFVSEKPFPQLHFTAYNSVFALTGKKKSVREIDTKPSKRKIKTPNRKILTS